MKIALIAGMAIAAGASAQQILPGVDGSPFVGSTIGSADRGPTLWEQLPDGLGNFVDQNFGDFASFATFMVQDVSFGSSVTITDITTYYTLGSGAWPSSGTATLNIYSRTGSLPGGGDDPLAGTSVPVTITPDGFGGLSVTASGLSVALGAGDYWVGLTPDLDFGSFGQEFHQSATPIGADNTAARNPGAGFGFGPDWFAAQDFGSVTDGAITILGTPTPGTLALLGLGGLVATRRRR